MDETSVHEPGPGPIVARKTKRQEKKKHTISVHLLLCHSAIPTPVPALE